MMRSADLTDPASWRGEERPMDPYCCTLVQFLDSRWLIGSRWPFSLGWQGLHQDIRLSGAHTLGAHVWQAEGLVAHTVHTQNTHTDAPISS